LIATAKQLGGFGAERQKITKGTLSRPLSFWAKELLLFLAALFLAALFLGCHLLFSLSIFHGSAVLSEKPQLMNV